VRYLHPSDEELRQFAPAPYKDKKEKKKVKTRILPLFAFYHYSPDSTLKSLLQSTGNVFLFFGLRKFAGFRRPTFAVPILCTVSSYVQCVCSSLQQYYLHTLPTVPVPYQPVRYHLRIDEIYLLIFWGRYGTGLPLTVVAYYCVPKQMGHINYLILYPSNHFRIEKRKRTVIASLMEPSKWRETLISALTLRPSVWGTLFNSGTIHGTYPIHPSSVPWYAIIADPDSLNPVLDICL
jgi:hypothetical protein